MREYLKYIIAPITILIAIYSISLGTFGPTIFIISDSLFMILGEVWTDTDP